MKLTVKLIIVAILGVLIWKLGSMAYERWFVDSVFPDREVYKIRGIDISHHNGDIDFERISKADTDVGFIYLKATEGTDYIDPHFVRNSTHALRTGVPVGVYHFFRYDSDGELQALNLLRALKGRSFHLPPAIDVEDWGNPDGHATATIVERLRALVDRLESYGYTPVIYTNLEGYHRLIKGNFDNYPLWIASFSNPPLDVDPDNIRWTIWQYSHRGSVPGISGDTDLNVINPNSIHQSQFPAL